MDGIVITGIILISMGVGGLAGMVAAWFLWGQAADELDAEWMVEQFDKIPVPEVTAE